MKTTSDQKVTAFAQLVWSHLKKWNIIFRDLNLILTQIILMIQWLYNRNQTISRRFLKLLHRNSPRGPSISGKYINFSEIFTRLCWSISKDVPSSSLRSTHLNRDWIDPPYFYLSHLRLDDPIKTNLLIKQRTGSELWWWKKNRGCRISDIRRIWLDEL